MAMVCSPLVSARHASRLASRVGIAARQVAACRSPASVTSRASSASISVGPKVLRRPGAARPG